MCGEGRNCVGRWVKGELVDMSLQVEKIATEESDTDSVYMLLMR